MYQSLDAWKNLATVSSSRSTSLLTFLPGVSEENEEENLRTEDQQLPSTVENLKHRHY
jgi:hypothetical protein